VLAGELLVPLPDVGRPPGVEVLSEAQELSFVVVSDEHGRSVLPAFTSEEALTRWKPEGSAYVALEGRVLLEVLAVSDWHRMVVDGADERWFAVTRADARERIDLSSR
jgi:SseB protein N-terminal domain